MPPPKTAAWYCFVYPRLAAQKRDLGTTDAENNMDIVKSSSFKSQHRRCVLRSDTHAVSSASHYDKTNGVKCSKSAVRHMVSNAV